MPNVPYDVTKESYLLKSTFFYDKLRSNGYFDLFLQVHTLCEIEGATLNWTQRQQWNISETAWEIVENSSISPMLVFVHPKVLTLNPHFLKYYRSVAMLPQKGLKAISRISTIEKIETGKVEPGSIASEVVKKLVCSINEVISLVISLSTDISENEIQGMMYATAGTNIDGSWRNSIGTEGERVIRSLIMREILTHGDVSSITDRQNKVKPISEMTAMGILESINNVRTVHLVNGYSILFSSEPDISMFDDSGAIVGIIEIKAGLDPAAALERLGAMLKSFENTLAEYPNAITILVASCITQEVQSRLGASMSVRQTYLTTQITSSESAQRKFANGVRRILKLTK